MNITQEQLDAAVRAAKAALMGDQPEARFVGAPGVRVAVEAAIPHILSGTVPAESVRRALYDIRQRAVLRVPMLARGLREAAELVEFHVIDSADPGAALPDAIPHILSQLRDLKRYSIMQFCSVPKAAAVENANGEFVAWKDVLALIEGKEQTCASSSPAATLPNDIPL